MRRVLGYSYVGDTNYPINNIGSLLISTADSTPTAATPTFAASTRAGINLGLGKEFNVSIPVATRTVSSSDNGRILVLKSTANPTSNSGCFVITNFDSGTNSYVVDFRSGAYLSGATSIASGSNGASLPQATINVASTTGFPSSGTILVTTTAGIQTVAYTGTNATQFTGCSGGTGTMSTGNTVNSQVAASSTILLVNSTTGFPSSGTLFVWSSTGRQTITYTGVTSTSFTGCAGGAGTLTGGTNPTGSGASVFATTINTTIAAGSNGQILPQSTINVASTQTASTTISASSNNIALPQSTINVASTTGFPTSGTIYVTTNQGIQLVTYTGTAGGTQFTGCSGGYGYMATGNTVYAGYAPSGIVYVTTSSGVQQVSYTGRTSTTFTGCTGGTGTMSTSNLVYYSPNVPMIEAADSMNWYLYEADFAAPPQSPYGTLSSPSFSVTNTGGTVGQPIQVTVSSTTGFVTGQYVSITGVTGANNGSNGTFQITVIDGTNFRLNGTTWGAASTYTGGGTVTIPYVQLPSTIYINPTSGFSSGNLFVNTLSNGYQRVSYTATGTYDGKLGFTGVSGIGFMNLGYSVFENSNNGNTTSQYRGNGTSTAPRIILQSPHSVGWQVRVCHETVDDSGSVNFLSQSAECAMVSVIPGFGGNASGDFQVGLDHLHAPLYLNSNSNNLQGGAPGFGDNTNSPTGTNSIPFRITIAGDTDGYGVSMFGRRPGNATSPRSYFLTYGIGETEPLPLPTNNAARLFTIGSGNSQSAGDNLNDISWYPGNISSSALAQGVALSEAYGSYAAPVSVCTSLLSYATGSGTKGSPVFDGSAGDTPWFGGVELFSVDVIAGTFSTWNNSSILNYGFPLPQARFLGSIPHIREGRANYAEYSTTADLVAQHMRRGLWLLWNGPPVVT